MKMNLRSADPGADLSLAWLIVSTPVYAIQQTVRLINPHPRKISIVNIFKSIS